jgi:hypothetical protein
VADINRNARPASSESAHRRLTTLLRIVLFWHVREGHYGDVKLDNLSFIRVGGWEGDPWARKATGVASLYIDEHADDRQMDALPAIIGGRAGGFPGWLNEYFAGDGRHHRSTHG